MCVGVGAGVGGGVDVGVGVGVCRNARKWPFSSNLLPLSSQDDNSINVCIIWKYVLNCSVSLSAKVRI